LDLGMRAFVSETIENIETIIGTITARDETGAVVATQTLTSTLP